jgi:hypothetical protein
MIRTVLFALLLAACGGSSASAPSPEPKPEPPPAAEEDGKTEPATPASCDDACTTYAMCYEEVHGEDFRGGGDCVSTCEERTAEEKEAYFDCVSGDDCGTVVKC